MTDKMHPNPSIALHERIYPFGDAKLYEVGGSVRDRLLGLPLKDHDYVITGLPAESFSTVFMWDKVDYVGQSFGVYKIQLREYGEPVTPVLDVALPRTERSTGPSHRDFAVTSDPDLKIEDDLARRDFTFNAMAFYVYDQQLIDPFGGQADLMNKTLRFVGDPAERIKEDPLRILRAYRFMVKLDLQVPAGETRKAMRQNVHLLNSVAPERIFSELMGMLSYQDAAPEALARALYCMLHDGVLSMIIPSYSIAHDYHQGTPYHHLTLADHMIESVAHGQRVGARPITKLALLLHDLGKPSTRTKGEDGRAHYYGHEDAGAQKAATLLAWSLLAPKATVDAVRILIEQHMRLSPRHPIGTKGLRRFMNDLGPLWRDSLDHRYADLMAHAPGLHEDADPAQWHADMVARCLALETTGIATLNEQTLQLSGFDVMTLLGLKEGREVGTIKKGLLQDVIEGVVENDRTALIARLKELHVAGT